MGAGPPPQPSQRSPQLALALASGYQHDAEHLLTMQQALFDAPKTVDPAGSKQGSGSPEPGTTEPVHLLNCTVPECSAACWTGLSACVTAA